MTRRWQWTPEVGARTAGAERDVSKRWHDRLAKTRDAFWEKQTQRNGKLRHARSLGEVLGMDRQADISDPMERKAIWRKNLSEYMMRAGVKAEEVQTLWKGFEEGDTDAREEIRLWDVEMREARKAIGE